MMNKILLIAASLNIIIAQNYNELFQIANNHYNADDFTQAISSYEEILARVEHEDVYYNLGNAYYRNGDIGNSIWAFEKAKILDPRDLDIDFNLHYLKTLVRDRIIPPDDLYILSLYNAMIEKFTLFDLLGMVGIFFLLFGMKYIMNYFSIITNRVNSVSGYMLFAFIFIFSWMGFDKYWSISDRSYAVILPTAIDVRSAPIMRGENVVFRIHEGTKVEIQDSQIGWSEIILLDGKKGWIPANKLREI